MPRKNNFVIVAARPKLTKGRLYHGRIKSVRLDKAANWLHLTIENLDQLGRLHELALPVPVYPANRTALFFLACGIDATTVGAKICLDQIGDAVVGMRFRGLGPDGAEEFDFEPISNPPAADEAGPA
jgi:hypothetical protein